jgi:hypothetical protein
MFIFKRKIETLKYVCLGHENTKRQSTIKQKRMCVVARCCVVTRCCVVVHCFVHIAMRIKK